MIVFKQKQYVVPGEEKFVRPTPFPIPNTWIGYRVNLNIVESDSYKNELKQRISPIWKEWRKDLKRTRREISEGFIYQDKTVGSSDTHYYPSESESDKRYYTSKSINGGDRLMYDIYAPELIINEEGNLIIIKIVLLHCIGHTHRNGKKFSET